jgi:hypothetical protein
MDRAKQFEGNRFNQTKTKTTELLIVRAGPVEKSIELTKQFIAVVIFYLHATS